MSNSENKVKYIQKIMSKAFTDAFNVEYQIGFISQVRFQLFYEFFFERELGYKLFNFLKKF